MSVQPGQQLLHYRLIEQIGEGGMGVVWKAIDTVLDREVAIKVLPPAFSADADRLSRFEREAKLLASLNHPNIAAIYGLHQAPDDGVHFIVMELAPGRDLSVRIAQGPLPLDEAVDVARQVALALEEAHERGIVHRDLKPANIQIAPDGKVKVLDFGLAKAFDAAPDNGSDSISHSPTLTTAPTVAGMILGTAAYMSPEQARGKPLDRRTDIWSFGCVLYEMLTGRASFEGESVADLISAVISREPDRDALPATTPPSIRRLLDRCLTKDPQRRLRDAADARLELDDADEAPAETTPVSDSVATPGRRPILPWALAALALLIAAAAWIGRPATGTAETTDATHIVAIEPLTTRMGAEYMPALSPDGRSLLYCARDGADADIFLVRVGGENAINLTADHDGWDGAPEFSRDGEKIAFASTRDGGGLFVMGATGESPRRVADEGTHPSWSPDGKQLVAATEQVGDPYSRATRSRVFVVDLESGETRDLPVEVDGVGPRWSPDGRWIAYWNEIAGQRDLWTIAVDGGQSVQVTNDPHTDWEPMWAEDGRALYFHSDRGGSADLWRIPIDLRTGAASGPATRVTTGVMPIWESSLSADGTRIIGTMRTTAAAVVAYPFEPKNGRVVGSPETLFEVSTKLTQPDLSPDGRTLAYRTMQPREIITTLELESGVRRRLTDDGFRNRGADWSPDGEWIAFYSNRSGTYQLWAMRPDGSDRFLMNEATVSDPAWSPDGKRIAVAAAMVSKARWRDTAFLTPDPDATSETAGWVLAEEHIEEFGPTAWSPDGRKLLGQIRTGAAGNLHVYDFDSGKVRAIPGAQRATSFFATWFPDSERVVYWDDDAHSAAIWNTRSGERTLLPEVAGPGDMMLSPDGRLLYALERRVNGDVWMLTLDGEAGAR